MALDLRLASLLDCPLPTWHDALGDTPRGMTPQGDLGIAPQEPIGFWDEPEPVAPATPQWASGDPNPNAS